MTIAVLIFTAILVYRLYREVKAVLLLVKAASKIAHDTAALVQEGPIATILALIHGIRAFHQKIQKKIKKRSSEMGTKTFKSFGIGLIAGAVIGGVIALLYAPQPGKKTRKLIKDKTTECTKYMSEVADTVNKETGGIVDKATKVVDKIVGTVK